MRGLSAFKTQKIRTILTNSADKMRYKLLLRKKNVQIIPPLSANHCYRRLG